MSLAFVAVSSLSFPVFLGTLVILICNTVIETSQRKTSKMFGQIKILLAFVQILGSMPGVMDSVPWGSPFTELTLPLSFVNLDFMGLLRFSACELSVSFLQSFAVHMVLPPLVMLSILCAWGLSNACCKPRTKTAQQHRRANAFKLVILAVLLLYPGVCSKAFQVLRCTSIDGVEGRVLAVDFAVECWQGRHSVYVLVDVFCILLYVIGIPLFMLFLLRRKRAALWDESHPEHRDVLFELGGLYSMYEVSVRSRAGI